MRKGNKSVSGQLYMNTNFELNKRLMCLYKFTWHIHFLSWGSVCKLETSSIGNTCMHMPLGSTLVGSHTKIRHGFQSHLSYARLDDVRK